MLVAIESSSRAGPSVRLPRAHGVGPSDCDSVPPVTAPAPLPPLVDSHCHLTWESFADDVEQVIARMAEEGVEQAVVVATSVENARACAALCDAHDGLYPTVGIHPNDVPEDVEAALQAFEALLHEGGFVAVGETGLDYFRDWSAVEDQKRSFRRHCELALANDLPVIVHIRDKDASWQAFDDVGEIIEAYPGLRGVIHCYTGDPEHARALPRVRTSWSRSPGSSRSRRARTYASPRCAVPIEQHARRDRQRRSSHRCRGGASATSPSYVAVHRARKVAELKGLSEADVRRITTKQHAAALPSARRARTRSGPATYAIRDSDLRERHERLRREAARSARAPTTTSRSRATTYVAPRDPTHSSRSSSGDRRSRRSTDEVVFCGFGEPTLRLDMVKQVAAWVKERGGKHAGQHERPQPT